MRDSFSRSKRSSTGAASLVSDNGAATVFEFAGAGTSVAATPRVALSPNPAFTGPLGLAFSSSGNLWVANNAGTSLEEFNAAALATTAATLTLAPNVVLVDNGQGTIQGSLGARLRRIWQSPVK